MSYEPTTWKDGDLVTSAKLNKLEQGVASAGGSGGGILVIHEDENGVLDRTWQEIHDADCCILKRDLDDGYQWVMTTRTQYEEGLYYTVSFNNNSPSYNTDSPNGYPFTTPK